MRSQNAFSDKINNEEEQNEENSQRSVESIGNINKKDEECLSQHDYNFPIEELWFVRSKQKAISPQINITRALMLKLGKDINENDWDQNDLKDSDCHNP
jgi:hypothetical protein